MEAGIKWTRLADWYLQGLSCVTHLKSASTIYPPPQNRQVWFTLKLPIPTYPTNWHIWFTPRISQFTSPNQITKSDLSLKSVRFTPSSEIVKSNLSLKSVRMIYPSNWWVWFTPQTKLLSLIYPSNWWVQFTPPQPQNSQVWFTPQISKYASMILPPPPHTHTPSKITKSNLPLKSAHMIYPSNWWVWFTHPPELPSLICPHKSGSMIYPPPIIILSTFFLLQHHALLHKGLFCERQMSRCKGYDWVQEGMKGERLRLSLTAR